MTKRVKRQKKEDDGPCRGCGREKGARGVPKCKRCPGQPVTDQLYMHPATGIRLVVCDTSTRLCGITVASPYFPHKLEMAETVDAFTEDPDTICKQVLDASSKDGAPCFMVIEDPGVGGPRANPTMILGMGQAIGIWRRSWIMAGGGDSRCLMVRQVTWCAGLIPTAYDRDARKKESMRQAPAIWGIDQIGFPPEDGYEPGYVPEAGSDKTFPIAWSEDLSDSGMIASFMLRWAEFREGIVGPMDLRAAQRIGGPWIREGA